MPRDLPPRASLEHLRKQAKALLRAYRERRPEAVDRFAALPRRTPPAAATLADAQHVVAREHGFASWARLKAHVEAHAASSERAADPREALVDAVRADDVARADAILARHAELRARLNEPMPGLPFDSLLLSAAVDRRSRAMVDLLLRHGADVNARSRWWAGGFGVLDTCAPELAPFLIERGATVDVHAAARLGLLDRLDALLAADPSLVHARGGDGQTPLHVAATVEVARRLLDRGADPDALDVDHESTPAQYAVRDRRDVARLLVEHGCRTDLLLVAALGDVDRVRAHLDADPACVHTRVDDQWFPMRDPRAGGHIYVWTLGRHRTAHRVAGDAGHDAVVRLLMERSPDALRFARACELGDQAALRAMLARRPDLARTLPDDERATLVAAAEDGDVAAVRRMLAAGWPVDARGRHGATALHFAAWHGHLDMVRALLRHGAPLEARSADFDMPPLGWALHGSLHSWRRDAGDHAGVVEALLHAGARPPAPDAAVEASAPALAALMRGRRGGRGGR